MKNYKLNKTQFNFSDLISVSTERLGAFYETLEEATPIEYSGTETGYHIYTNLRLPLKLSAAEGVQSAKNYLKIINGYAQQAQAFATIYGITILELQGEVIHYFYDTPKSEDSTLRVIAFVKELHDAIKNGISDAPFVGTCDYGKTVFVKEGLGSSASVVSLSPAANAPAKQLGADKTPSGHIAIPSNLSDDIDVLKNIKKSQWLMVSLSEMPQSLSESMTMQFSTKELRGDYIQQANEAFASYQAPTILFSQEDLREYNIEGATPETPAILQGFYMRADLDGFTKTVETAFAQGNVAIAGLVQSFVSQMEYANTFIETQQLKVNKIQKFPWAGDCANFLALPLESYSNAQRSLPVHLAANWHDLCEEESPDGGRWKDRFEDAGWAVVVAGGTDSESDDTGNSGRTLVAKIQLKDRQFLIAAGWSPGRCVDGLEAGAGKDETIIHDADKKELSQPLEKLFSELDSRFWKKRRLSKKSIETAVAGIAMPSIINPATHRSVEPRPYYDYE